MAGKNTSNAWNSIKFIKSHLAVWEKKGMSEAFLNSIISPKYKKCEIDVESALTCDMNAFQTLYNQPDFIPKLKELCKKYRLPYGKVKPEVEKSAEDMASMICSTMFKDRPIRLTKGEKSSGLANIMENACEVNYIPHKVVNAVELSEYIKKNCTPGYLKLVKSPESIEMMMSLARDGVSRALILKIFRVKDNSLRKYYGMYKKYGLGDFSRNKASNHEFNINYDVVKFEDGYTGETEDYCCDLFGD